MDSNHPGHYPHPQRFYSYPSKFDEEAWLNVIMPFILPFWQRMDNIWTWPVHLYSCPQGGKWYVVCPNLSACRVHKTHRFWVISHISSSESTRAQTIFDGQVVGRYHESRKNWPIWQKKNFFQNKINLELGKHTIFGREISQIYEKLWVLVIFPHSATRLP